MPKQKRWMVVPRDKKAALFGLKTGRGHRTFHPKSGVMYLKDGAEAAEVDSRYGLKGSGKVFVYEDDRYAHALNNESWEIKRDNRTGADYVKTLHHYSQLISLTLPDVSLRERWARLMKRYPTPFHWVFTWWSYTNENYEREVGFRLFGREYTLKGRR